MKTALWTAASLLACLLLSSSRLPAQQLYKDLGNGEWVEDLKEAFDDLRHGRRERARSGFEEILASLEDEQEAASGGEVARALAGLAWIDLETGNYEEGIKRIARARKLEPLIEFEVLDARLHSRLGKYDDALKLTRAVLGRTKNVAMTLECKVRMAEWLETTGKQDQAQSLLREVEDQGQRTTVTDTGAKFWYADALQKLGGGDRLSTASSLLIEVSREDPLFAESYVVRGDMFHRVYREAAGRPSGESEYKLALKHCGEVEDALVGLFVSRSENYLLDYKKTLGYLNRALDLNPRSVPALRAKASRFIDDRNFEAAYRLLVRAIAINPKDRLSLAELASVSHLTYREAEEKQYAQRYRELDSTGRDLYSVLGRHLIALYRFADAVPVLTKAVRADEKHADSLFALGKALIYSGRGNEGADLLKKTQDLLPGFINPWRENQLFLHNRITNNYEEVDAGNFKFVISPAEKEVLLPYLKETYEEAWKLLGARYGTFPVCQVRVEDFERFGDFSVRTTGFKGFSALGACFGCLITSVSPSAPEIRQQFSWKVTAWHEFSHVLHLQLSKARVPRWLTEGLAVYEEVTLDPSFDRRMERELYSAWRNDEIMSVATLNSAFRTSQILFGYYQGGLVVRHLTREYGFEKVLAMLRAFGEDKSMEQIFNDVFGMGTGDYDAKFKSYVQELVGNYRLVPSVSDERIAQLRLHVAQNPKDVPARLMLAEGYAQRGLNVDAGTQLSALKQLAPDNGEAFLIRARMAFRRKNIPETRRLLRKGFENGGSDFDSHMLHASLLMQARRPADALKEYEQAIVCWPTCVSPGSGSPYLGKVQVLLQQEQTDEAMKTLEQYAALNGRDYEARIQLAKYYRKQGDTKKELQHLERARDIDPFDRELHERLATIYREAGRHGDAKRVLEVCLAILPERDRSRRAAQPQPGAQQPGPVEEEWKFQARIRLELARTMLDLGDRPGAEKLARRVLEEGERLPKELRDRAQAILDR